MAVVNCEEARQACAEFDVTSYPTMMTLLPNRVMSKLRIFIFRDSPRLSAPSVSFLLLLLLLGLRCEGIQAVRVIYPESQLYGTVCAAGTERSAPTPSNI